ncbi:hypothetical protein NFHSH190041_08840 [Shewanella sp. NFH-SH190041]|uniref:J domain-containing protein n=1 Tax=Shewanella sp. NFH-SH190041 TaxID=2950245 RepID=UPI0021C4980B|nr:J domain-containing protein [Shewanella sp. NFH-SH190041]BDM63432.1 hypothetical protein NFHSH190041_08840 [Shewanella sp. NFH-SH190041]
MTIWHTLQLAPTKDTQAIKTAYRQQLKTTHPEEDPQAFQALRLAYETALKLAAQPDEEATTTATNGPVTDRAEENTDKDPLIIELETLLDNPVTRFDIAQWQRWVEQYPLVSLNRQQIIFRQVLDTMLPCSDWMIGEVYELLWQTFEWDGFRQQPDTENLGDYLYQLTQQDCLMEPAVLSTMTDSEQKSIQQHLVPLARALSFRDTNALRQLLRAPLPEVDCETYRISMLRLYSAIGQCPDAVLRQILDASFAAQEEYIPQIWRMLAQLCQQKGWYYDVNLCLDKLQAQFEYASVAQLVIQANLKQDPLLALAMALVVQHWQRKRAAYWRLQRQLKPAADDTQLQLLYLELLGNPLITLNQIDAKLLSPASLPELMFSHNLIEQLGTVSQIRHILSILEQQNIDEKLRHPDWQRWCTLASAQLKYILEYLNTNPEIIDVLEKRILLMPTQERIEALDQSQWIQLLRRYPNMPQEWINALQQYDMIPDSNQPLAAIGDYFQQEHNQYQAYLCYLRQPNKKAEYTQKLADIQYRYGRACRQEYMANQWYLTAAENGHPEAQAELGIAYRDGNGVKKNLTAAFNWFSKAAEQGHAISQLNAGYMCDHGWGVMVHKGKAFELYQLAAEQGDMIAQYNLAIMYCNGDFVAEDYVIARHWFEESATQGYIAAQYKLAGIFKNGLGVAQDLQRALTLYQAAADQDWADAQFELAQIYQQGCGTEVDEKLAEYWYQKAIDNGNTEAKAALERLRNGGVIEMVHRPIFSNFLGRFWQKEKDRAD